MPAGLAEKQAPTTASAANGTGAASAALKKEVAALRKREGELVARVAALEAEVGVGTGARTELEGAKTELEAQLKARSGGSGGQGLWGGGAYIPCCCSMNHQDGDGVRLAGASSARA